MTSIRDYKEHGARRGDDIAASTPSLNRDNLDKSVRSWTSTQNLSSNDNSNNNVVEITAPLRLRQRPSSWSSTPDLEEAQKSQRTVHPKVVEEVVVNLQLPARRRHTAANFDNVEESFSFKRPTSNGSPPQQSDTEEAVTISKTDSLAERVRKMQMMKRQGSLERDLNREGSLPRR